MKKKEIFYTIADIVRTVKGEPPSRFTSAIIVAAGNSVRMGEGISKQMAMLDGMPVVVRTLRAYQQSPQIDEIIVVAREDEIARYYEFRDKYRLTKLTHVVRYERFEEGARARRLCCHCGCRTSFDHPRYD